MKNIRKSFFLFLLIIPVASHGMEGHFDTANPSRNPIVDGLSAAAKEYSSYAKSYSSYLSPSSWISQRADTTTQTPTQDSKSIANSQAHNSEYNPNDGFDIQMNSPVLDFAGQCIGNCASYVKKATTSAVNYGKKTAGNINETINFVLNPDAVAESYLGYTVDEQNGEKTPVQENHLSTVDYQAIGQGLKNDIVEQATPVINNAINSATDTANTVATSLGTAAKVVGNETIKLGTAIGTDVVNLAVPVIAPHVVKYIESINLPEHNPTQAPSPEVVTPQTLNPSSPQFSSETQQAFSQMQSAAVNKGVQYGARMATNHLKNIQKGAQLKKITPVIKPETNKLSTNEQALSNKNSLKLNDQTHAEIISTLQTLSPAAGAVAKVALSPTLENATNAVLTPGVLTTTGAATGATVGAVIGGVIGGAADASVQGTKAIMQGANQVANTVGNAFASKPLSRSERTTLPNGDDQVVRYENGQKVQTVIRSQGQAGVVTFKDYDANDKLQKATTQYPGSKQGTIRFYDAQENIQAIKSVNADGTYTVTQYTTDKIITTKYDAQNKQLGQPITNSITISSQKSTNSWW